MRITTLSSLPNRGSVAFTYRGKPAILVRWDDAIRAYVNVCTHMGGPTRLEGDVLRCEWHQAEFDPASGRALSGPAPSGSRLEEIPIEIRGDEVHTVEDA